MNYWELRPFLPKQTRNYIPSFIAAIYVMNFASEYNIYMDESSVFYEELIDSVLFEKRIKNRALSIVIKCKYEHDRALKSCLSN